jgi:hypothetical protein
MRPELIWQLARILTPGLRTSGRNIAVVNQFAPVINQEMAASVCETIKHGHQVWCSPIPARASVSVTMNMRVSVPKSSTRRRKLFARAELVVKVKEPQGGEGAMLASPDFPIPQLSLNQKVREATIG